MTKKIISLILIFAMLIPFSPAVAADNTSAAPTTTTSSTVSATKYQCIHNVINEDDLVPQLPLVNWDFKRYGSDHTASIETTYASQWDSLVSGSENYKSSTTALGTTVTVLGNVATNRNACYVYRTDDSAYYEMSYTTADERDLQWSIQINLYPNNVDGLYYYTYSQTTLPLAYKYRFYQKPAFFMQLLAATKAEELSEVSFGIIGVAYYLADAKAQLVALSLNDYINHPHYPESYYLLATKIST